MANTKSFIREINLQNATINLNKNKSIVTDFVGFNKNTGVWYNNALSNLYYSEQPESDVTEYIIGNDTYTIKDGVLYKNNVQLKDYSDYDIVSANIITNLDKNTIAYRDGVNVHVVGGEVYVNDTLLTDYDTDAIPYVISYDANNWCVLYNGYFTSNTVAPFYTGGKYTTALYDNGVWYVCKGIVNNEVLLLNTSTNATTSLAFTAPNVLKGHVVLTGYTPSYTLKNIGAKTIFAGINSYDIDSPSITVNKVYGEFQYLKGLFIKIDEVAPWYSQRGQDISFLPGDTSELDTWANSKNGINLKQVKTKYLTYNSELVMPYAYDIQSGNPTTTYTTDGMATFIWESGFTIDNVEFVTLSGPTSSNTTSLQAAIALYNDKVLPKPLGLVDSTLATQWLYTDYDKYKLIYNKDALVNISLDGNILCPWNDIDENTLTITGNDIYYYSLNSNAWVHINISKENKISALVIDNMLLLNTINDNFVTSDGINTYNADSSFANFHSKVPNIGFINLIGIMTTSFSDLKSLLDVVYEVLTRTDVASSFYISITNDNGPMWNALTALQYKNPTFNRIQHSGAGTIPLYGNIVMNSGYILDKLSLASTDVLDIYKSDTPTVLSYYTSWNKTVYKYNIKLQDTEKSFNEPTYYNLAPLVNIMTVIDGFNTIVLVKVGNYTQKLLVKNGQILPLYNILSGVDNITEYFVLQGQQYGIINNYINKIEMADNNIISQVPITSVDGLKFLGNTDKQAFFFSQMNKTILYFAADNTLEFLTDATELDGNVTSVFAKQTNDIFLLLNDKVVVLTNSGSMFEIDDRAEYITFGDVSWSDGNKSWSYYELDNQQKRYPINIETLWYGDTVNRKMMNVDCVYMELYDDNYKPGKFEISMDSLMNNTVSTKKQVFNVKEKDYDRITKTVYLRFQPAFQSSTTFKLNINSELPIKRLAVGYTQEGIPLISKNNI
jgi:hypothetical protein